MDELVYCWIGREFGLELGYLRDFLVKKIKILIGLCFRYIFVLIL